MGTPLEHRSEAPKPRNRSVSRSSNRGSGRLSTDSIGWYLSNIGRVPLLTAAEEIELAHQVQQMKQLSEISAEERTPKQRQQVRMGCRARDRMMAANLRLVVSVAKKYQNQGLELLDLVQEGAIGLERAVDKFDPAMGYKFSTYAYWWIRQGITRAIATQSRTIRLPVHITEKLNRIKKAQRDIAGRLGRTASLKDLATELQLSEEVVRQTLMRVPRSVSLDTRVGRDMDTELGDLLEDGMPTPEQRLTREKLHDDLLGLLNELSGREARVIRLRFGLDDDTPQTLAEIGKSLDLSRERVRQIESRALHKLRLPERRSRVRDYMEDLD